ncbi:MAG TPA: efflux RND transporter periplasmic adaptor subunit [Gammaproteobacteria bacterium]
MVHRRYMPTILSATAAFALSGCYQQPEELRANREQQIPAVEAVEVVRGSLPLEERLAGSVLARNQTDIYPEVAGRIVEVLANDGDHVEAGQPLVRLHSTEYEEQLQQAEAGLRVAEARVQQAEANLARAQADLERIEAIAARDLASRAELDAIRAQALSAQAEVALMRAERAQAQSLVEERRNALAETVVRAPIAGVVGGRNAEVGQLATTTTPLFVIGDPEAVRVTVTLTQRMLSYIEVGTPVNIYTEAQDEQPIAAQISRISPFLHPVTRTTRAEIDVEQNDGRLRPGMFVTVDVLYGESQLSSLVPNSAVYTHPRDGRQGVYLARLADANRDLEGTGTESLPRPILEPSGPVAVEFVPVRVIARGREASAVEGVEPGQWVVTVGHHLLSSSDSGQAVVQPTPWDHIMRLQRMQSRDLLEMIQLRQEQLRDEAPTLN